MTEWDLLITAIGAALLGNDAADVGKFDRIHHWQIGAILVSIPTLKQLWRRLSE